MRWLAVAPCDTGGNSSVELLQRMLGPLALESLICYCCRFSSGTGAREPGSALNSGGWSGWVVEVGCVRTAGVGGVRPPWPRSLLREPVLCSSCAREPECESEMRNLVGQAKTRLCGRGWGLGFGAD